MATLSNPVFYSDGATISSPKLVGYYGGNRVVRYTLTTGANEGGTSISIFIDGNGYIEWAGGSDFDEVNKDITLYFKIGTSSTEFVNAGKDQISQATGKVTMVLNPTGTDPDYDVSLEGNVTLNPNTTYYLWIYPGYSGATHGRWEWNDNGTGRCTYTIELLGRVNRFIYIDNGTGWDPYEIYIDNGKSWDLYEAYIDNGSGWDPCQ